MTDSGPTPALVLTGGGARGAYQVGVLRRVARDHPGFAFPIVTGVSAGAINAAFLASHRGEPVEALDELVGHWSALSVSRVMRADPPSLLRNALRVVGSVASGGARLAPPVRGLADTRPLRTVLEGLIDSDRVAKNIEEGKLRALAISATSYRSGLSVTFVQGPANAPTWSRARRRSRTAEIGVDHVLASAAIPLFFPACPVDGEHFGDGSLRQTAPLAPAIHLGADRILAISPRYMEPSADSRDGDEYPSTARIMGLMLNSIFLDQLDADAERLERVNQLVQKVDAADRWRLDEHHVELLVVRPSRDIAKMAAHYERRMPRALRYLIRGLGTRGGAGSDLLSYLLFVPDFLRDLIALGERDAEVNRAKIARFVESCSGG
jgi:NTE family protein